jgi:hypothetical protein
MWGISMSLWLPVANLSALLICCLSANSNADQTKPVMGGGVKSDCVASASISPICGLVGPEDIELSKDGHTLFVSELPADFDHPRGPGLMQVDTRTLEVKPLPIRKDWKAGWGSGDCKSPPVNGFSTHGIHLSTRKDGKTELLAVNHDGRDSIEAFELQGSPGHYEVIWRGCTTFSGGPFNDVTALPGGGFIATVMLDKTLTTDADATSLLFSGKKTGYLVEWHADSGFKRLPGSEAALNNGIQLSADGTELYFAAFSGRQIIRYSRVEQRITGTVDVRFYPDNLSVQPDGRFLVSGMNDLEKFRVCTLAQGGYCTDLLAFTVASFDPVTMTTSTIYEGQPGVMAGASVAIAIKDELFIGTYTGDRMVRIALPKSGY